MRPSKILFLVALLSVATLVTALPLIGTTAEASGTSQLVIASQNTSGATITGYYTVLSQSGSTVATGFTPATFTLDDGQTYSVQADGYGSCAFSRWADTGSPSSSRTVSITNDTRYTAIYDCGTSASNVTVNSVDLAGNAISGYYVVLKQGTAVVATGFTLATLPTTAGQTYSVQADGYGSCAFAKWSDGVTTDPRPLTATSSGTTFTAVYNCGTTTTTTSSTTTSSTTTSSTTTSSTSTTTSTSTVSVDSVNQFGNPITGYYTALYNSGGTVLGSGFTPATFNTTSGQTYGVRMDGYGSCTFTKWSDGVTTDPRSFAAPSSGTTFTGVYDCASASPYSTLTIRSVNQAGSSATGYAVTILNSQGQAVDTATTPLAFNTTVGQSYEVRASSGSGSGGSCTFSYWSGNGSTNLPLTLTATSAPQYLTGVFDCNSNGGPTSITVYAHRIPAGYWAPCFATACAAGTGPGATMYFALYNSDGTLIATGFANENGYTFTGLTAGDTYYVRAENCDSCHGSTHDVLFDHWGDANTTDPVAVVAGSSLDAWYSCTNGCGGG